VRCTVMPHIVATVLASSQRPSGCRANRCSPIHTRDFIIAKRAKDGSLVSERGIVNPRFDTVVGQGLTRLWGLASVRADVE